MKSRILGKDFHLKAKKRKEKYKLIAEDIQSMISLNHRLEWKTKVLLASIDSMHGSIKRYKKELTNHKVFIQKLKDDGRVTNEELKQYYPKVKS